MTPAQTKTVSDLTRQGFQFVLEAKGIVRMTRGIDKRVILADGSMKRGHHQFGPKEARA